MSEFRVIAPSTQTHSSGSSSGYRDNGRKDSSGGSGGTSGGGSSKGTGDSGQRRRRITGHVSALACTECRRARAKV